MKTDEDILLIIGKNIKKIRRARKLTQVAIEVSAKLSESDLSRIEKGQVNFSITKLIRIAAVLNVELNELYPLN